MINRILPTSFQPKGDCPHIFQMTVTGDLTPSIRTGTAKFVRKLNRKFEKELLRIDDLAKESVLLTQEARHEMKMLVFIPDESTPTAHEMKYILSQVEPMTASCMGAERVLFEYRPRLKLVRDDGTPSYHSLDYVSETSAFEMEEIFPLNGAEYADMINRVRSVDTFQDICGILNEVNYSLETEYNTNRYVPVQMRFFYVDALSFMKATFETAPQFDTQGFEDYLNLAHRMEDMTLSDFDAESATRHFAAAQFPNNQLRALMRAKEICLGAWLGEYIHTLRPSLEWHDLDIHTGDARTHFILIDSETGDQLDVMGLIRTFLKTQDDAPIRALIHSMNASEQVSSELTAVEPDAEPEEKEEALTPDEERELFEKMAALLGQSEDSSRPLTVVCPSTLSAKTQEYIRSLFASLNEELGFPALECFLADQQEDDWNAGHKASISFLEMTLASSPMSDEERAETEAQLAALKSETFDPSACDFYFELNTAPTYSEDNLYKTCRVFQKALSALCEECGSENIQFAPGQRIALGDGHTWVSLTLEGPEVIWRDEPCPYEGEYARLLQKTVYDEYDSAADLNDKLMNVPQSIFRNDPALYAPALERIRALRFSGIMSVFFDKNIDISIDSLDSVAMFLKAVRDSLTPDRMRLMKDASPRIVYLFKTLLKREDDDGALEFQNLGDVLYQDIIMPLSSWLGELIRDTCANLIWTTETTVDGNGQKTAESVLKQTYQNSTLYPISYGERFFYEQDALDIKTHYYELIEQGGLLPADKHEHRFLHLPEDNLPDNIIPFRKR